MADLLAAAPAIMLTGPRATGKTTTALRHVIDTARLDRPGEAAAFHADPDAALAARPTPLLVDEWHVVPGVLGAVKRAVDTDPRPGRYVIPTFLDTQVTAQVRAEVSASDAMPRLYHLRDRDGHEIDLLLDYGRRGQLAIEVKATSAPTRHDARHLIWLRERLPTLRAGLVLHTGPRVYRLDDTIAAVPIAALWA